MRSRIQTLFIALILSLLVLPVNQVAAQSPHHLLIGNGGVFGPSNYVTVASWEISSGIYQVFDSIPASSVQDLITAGPYAWLAADSFLVKYDLSNYQRLDSVVVPGIRKIAVWEDLVVVTRGFGASSDYVQAFQVSDLSPEFSVSGITGECEGIVVVDDTAYVAVPLEFGNAGNLLAAIDLTSGSLIRELPLDSSGLNAGRVLSNGGEVYVVLESPFGGTFGRIAHYTPGSMGTTDFSIQHHVSGGAGIDGGELYLFLDGNLGNYSPSTQMVGNAAVVPGSWAGAEVDTLNQEYYLSETDYFSYGLLKRFNASGQVLDSVSVGISPEALALDSWVSTSAAAPAHAEAGIRLWPNPAGDHLYLELPGSRSLNLRVTDLMGRDCLPSRKVSRFAEIDLGALPDGTYVLMAESSELRATQKFIKLSR